jgi:hypothetical protein
MRLNGALGLLVAATALSACAQNPHHLNTHYLERFATAQPTPAYFTVCHGFTCSQKSPASLSKAQWQRVAAVFQPRATTARHERQQVARAVALIQTFVGPQTGTAVHQWTHRNMYVLPNLGDLTQLDCIDTAVNTWTYTTMMERGGLLRFHKVAQLSYAGLQTDVNARNTAVLQEKDGGYFAIDASLVDHAEPPLVMPLTAWMADWPPDPGAIERSAKADATVARPAGARSRTRTSAMAGD